MTYTMKSDPFNISRIFYGDEIVVREYIKFNIFIGDVTYDCHTP